MKVNYLSKRLGGTQESYRTDRRVEGEHWHRRGLKETTRNHQRPCSGYMPNAECRSTRRRRQPRFGISSEKDGYRENYCLMARTQCIFQAPKLHQPACPHWAGTGSCDSLNSATDDIIWLMAPLAWCILLLYLTLRLKKATIRNIRFIRCCPSTFVGGCPVV